MTTLGEISPSKIKQCPFCGLTPPAADSIIINKKRKYLIIHKCRNLIVKTIMFETPEEAIEVWNRRFVEYK